MWQAGLNVATGHNDGPAQGYTPAGGQQISALFTYTYGCEREFVSFAIIPVAPSRRRLLCVAQNAKLAA
jgi:hypothetical protein